MRPLQTQPASFWDRLAAGAQGGYFLLTGLWAIVHRPSFELITGPKVDYWLVITVSLQICAVGGSLLFAAVRAAISGAVRLLGALSATGFLFVDVYYPMIGRIAPTYLVDAPVQFAFIIAWIGLALRSRADRSAP